jgi:hypothetical protein
MWVETDDGGDLDDLDDVEARLMAKFGHHLRAEQIERCLVDVIASFQDARVRQYLPMLIERAATERLTAAVRDGVGTGAAR